MLPIRSLTTIAALCVCLAFLMGGCPDSSSTANRTANLTPEQIAAIQAWAEASKSIPPVPTAAPGAPAPSVPTAPAPPAPVDPAAMALGALLRETLVRVGGPMIGPVLGAAAVILLPMLWKKITGQSNEPAATFPLPPKT